MLGQVSSTQVDTEGTNTYQREKKYLLLISFQLFTVETEDKNSTSTFPLYLKILVRAYNRC